VTFERWEREKTAAEERRLLYVAATRARDRLFLLEGGKGKGTDLRDALREGIGAGVSAGEGVCPLTGLSGERVRLGDPAADGSLGGELLRVAVRRPLEEARPAASPIFPVSPPEGREEEPEPESLPLPAPEPVTLAELYDRARGKAFGEKVHRVFEAFPPVISPWPPKRAVLPVEWEGRESERWGKIVLAVRTSAFHRRLCAARLVGTELPLLGFHAGRVAEGRADLVVRAEGTPGGAEAHWVVDYKTGPREPGAEGAYRLQVREYCAILAEAWGVPVRGFLWYVETGEAAEV
jgi:ATP-dependent exoDNAse (exonuclease V) beta subunit